MKWIKIVAVSLCVVALVLGCDSPAANRSGSIVLIFEESMGVKTITPELDMEVAEYLAEGTGPAGTSFSEVFAPPAGVVEHLVPGPWAIQVTCRNDVGPDIGSGNTTVDVIAGSVATANVVIQPFDGTGRLFLDFSWPADTMSSPLIEVDLDDHGSIAELECELAPDQLSASFPRAAFPDDNILSAGYYLMIARLFDDAVAPDPHRHTG